MSRWSIRPEGEAPARVVDLERGEAEVKEDAVESRFGESQRAGRRSRSMRVNRRPEIPEASISARIAASGSRSRATSCTLSAASRIARAWPPPPNVQSRVAAPGGWRQELQDLAKEDRLVSGNHARGREIRKHQSHEGTSCRAAGAFRPQA